VISLFLGMLTDCFKEQLVKINTSDKRITLFIAFPQVFLVKVRMITLKP